MDDRLLAPEEIMELSRKRAMFPEDWCKAQDAKSIKERDKRWIEEIDKYFEYEPWMTIDDWQELKKQIEGG